MSDTEQTTEQTTEQISRRRLLKMASYVPPALLGAMLMNRPAIAGGAPPGGQCSLPGGGTVSAPAGSCCPCVPASNEYNAKTCCKNHCDPAACDAYVVSSGYSATTCKNVNNWCGAAPAGCNCCLNKKGQFVCRNPGQVCK